MKRLISASQIMLLLFAAGLTMALLAQWLRYPGKGFQVVGTLIMFGVCLVWTYRTPISEGRRNN